MGKNDTVFVDVFRWSRLKVDQNEDSVEGILKIHNDFYSPQLKNKRSIRVLLPEDYFKHPLKRYPVLYMQDGQNLFQASTSFLGEEWRVDETCSALASSKKLEPLIVVGIDNLSDRMKEYTMRSKGNQEGLGREYLQFLVYTVKPFIDKTYRTLPGREMTGLMGSSLGGLISFYGGFLYSDIFSRIAVVSPSVTWDHEHLRRFFEKHSFPSPSLKKIWLDMGTKEGEGTETLRVFRDLKKAMKEKEINKKTQISFFEVLGGKHNEKDWAERFGRIVLFIFGDMKIEQ